MTTPILTRLARGGPTLREAAQTGNVRVLASLLGPAFRGLVQQKGKNELRTTLAVAGDVRFDWRYDRAEPQLARLYEAAKTSQWNATEDLDWTRDVDPEDPAQALLPEEFLPMARHPDFRALNAKERGRQVHAVTAWLLSQFLHGEQGALYAACQVTQAVPWMDGKLYGSTQVVDEGRHVEVFHGYLTRKLEKLYEINDNLYVIVDALMTDARWDVKFLGMQILIEGLALGAFGFLRQKTREPLLRELLTRVITDEARHVHYGVLALRNFYENELSDRERREREDWAFQVSVLMRNRFLAHEFYDEYWAHALTRPQWDALVLQSDMMQLFRTTMFKRIVPNLKAIGLLSDRIRPRYAAEGLLTFEHGKAAPELRAQDLLDDQPEQPGQAAARPSPARP